MHAFIFLVLMTPSSGGGIWDITPMPNTDVCIKMLRVLEARGGRGYGSNTGECIEIKTREPLNSVMETLSEGGYRLSWQTFVNGCVYWWCTTLGPMRDIIRSQPVYTIQYYGQSLEYTSEQILADKYTIWCGEQLWTSFVFAAVVSLVICIVRLC